MGHRRSTVGAALTIRSAVASLLIALPAIAYTAPAENPERITINDNRHPAGRLAGTELTVRLVAREGRWFPDGPDRPGIVVRAFAVEGEPLQVPGPLLRVPEGTRIHAIVRNDLGREPLAFHGLYSRPGAGQDSVPPVVVPSGTEREFSFAADGTYFYWGSTDATTPLNQRTGADSQLSGGLIVDAKNATTDDRVLLIGGWSNVDPAFLNLAAQPTNG